MNHIVLTLAHEVGAIITTIREMRKPRHRQLDGMAKVTQPVSGSWLHVPNSLAVLT